MLRRKSHALLACGMVFTGAGGPAAVAQTSAKVSPPTRDDLMRGETPDAAPPTRLTIEGGIERAPCTLDERAYSDIRIDIAAISFNHAELAPDVDLSPAFAAYLGGRYPVSALCDIRDRAATLLRDAGYMAAVQVPAQRIEDGAIRFEILFARVAQIRVLGDAGRTERLLAGYLRHLTRDTVFNRNIAERYLLLARDLPGYDVKLSLKPAGTGAGALIGEVTVRRTPVMLDHNIQNFAGHDTGPWGQQLRAQFNGLTGLGDRTTVSLYATADESEQKILQLGHEFRLGSEGLTVSGDFTYAWTRPDLGVDVRARTLFATGEVSYPLLRSSIANIRGHIGMDLVNQRVGFAGIPLSEDKLRVAWLRIDADRADGRARLGGIPAWRASGSIELRRGMDIFGASQGCLANPAACTQSGAVAPSRPTGDPTATVVRLDGLAEIQLPARLGFSLRPRAQYAFDPLLSFEQYSAGNYTIGRGYMPGTLIGDSGLGVQAELNMRAIRTGSDIALQPFAFVDSAWVWIKDAPGGAQRLTSVGGGVRTSLRDRMRLDVTIAIPTDRAGLQTKSGDARLLVSLTTKLLPWMTR
ncbi:ShlB/FhaC/HecB family hemolysin secretion/activation protein [Sphingobium boeckii]|uniref:Hemolysin activation/secretion protein n=1 Tax=Sphingobium boeckii TaxID=1082345 RepID=A0A7W9EF82_9SPHN|nr:ShlB/FhaC/HecB family hemolysin secretion/activation protein [Sphingobium boeckii]MBB5685446.1 hemolysin activation/secretion protein [Sphingobium boeckii]